MNTTVHMTWRIRPHEVLTGHPGGGTWGVSEFERDFTRAMAHELFRLRSARPLRPRTGGACE